MNSPLSPYGELVMKWSEATWNLKVRGLLFMGGIEERIKDVREAVDSLRDPRLEYGADGAAKGIKSHWFDDFRQYVRMMHRLDVETAYPMYAEVQKFVN